MTQWRNKIEVKQYLTDDDSDQSVLKICENIIPQLKFILRREQRNLEKDNIKNGIVKENIEYVVDELEALVEEFEWIVDMINEETSTEEFGYENWCEAFNNYFEQLYNIADTITIPRSFHDAEKFLWVG